MSNMWFLSRWRRAEGDSAARMAIRSACAGYTTVMLRNIPNKYTREMLVKQLNQAQPPGWLATDRWVEFIVANGVV